ncbi:protein cereblon-like isoform X2 [Lineus longissimus]|uniref:protein cereblon-like isoform X2 n=1 Tax=Lineus longissimus TaxID=88925 RepID=UPI00315C7879
MAEDDMLPLLGFELDGDEDDDDEIELEEEPQDFPPTDMAEGNAEAGGDESKKKSDKDEKKKKKERRGSEVNYDRSLPAAHSYLGSDLEELHGRTIHDDDSYQSLPLLSLPGVVLVPGQTLPLHIFQQQIVSMIRHCVNTDKTFGLVNSRYLSDDFVPTLANIGTTAEILSLKEDSDDATGISEVKMKAIGRQRFRVMETRRQTDGVVMAQVRILPEKVLSECLFGARPQSQCKCCFLEPVKKREVVQSVAVNRSGNYFTYPSSTKRRKIDRFTAADVTWWPPWVYRQYDVIYLMESMKNELTSWNDTIQGDRMPQDPVEFSFWVAGNLPLDDSMKLRLLQIDNAVQRLRCELSIMQKCTKLCCRECGHHIANKNDVFTLSLEGPMGTFVNPGGYVHETLTVFKAQGLTFIGRPSTEHSWFPGYAWTILQCRHCASHMGWKFTAHKKKLKPDKFFGLTRTAIIPGLDNQEHEWMPSI